MTPTALSDAREVSMADSWYDLANADHFWIEWRYKVIREVVRDYLNLTLRGLDIGCGDGGTLRRLENDSEFVIDGCELNPAVLGIAKVGKGKLFSYDILSRKLINPPYDLVILLDVVEHIEDDREFIRAASDHLLPGGKILLNVPALQSLFSKYDTAAGHVRRYSRQSLEAVLTECGFELINITYWGFTLLPLAFVRKFYLNFVPKELVIDRGFKPPGKIFEIIIRSVGRLERFLFKALPLGTSVVALAQKKL